MDEAHVEHAVGFVEHEDFHVGQVDGPLPDQVEQTARAGHQHVQTLGQSLDLGIHADAAEYAGALERQVAGIQLEAVMHLGGQFTGGCQHQHARLLGDVAMGFVRVTTRKQQFEYGQCETAGFAGARLGGDHQVAALQHGGNGPLLHRSGLGVASGLDGAGQCLGETEGSKGHG